jgi:hypothetical protein
MIQIGYLSACIAGDNRYTSILKVEADPATKKVTVKVKELGAVGGMDGPGGSYDAGTRYNVTLDNPSARTLINTVRDAIESDATLTGYGKPTKNFEWTGGYPRVKGLSATKAKDALAGAWAK